MWAKKIRGKMHYFGLWNDPDGAKKKDDAEKEALHNGTKPREDAEGFTVKMHCNSFLNAKQALVDSSELTFRTWHNYKETCDFVLAKFGKARVVANLDPDDFADLRTAMVGKGWGAVILGNCIQRTRVHFKFVFDNGSIDRPVRYGQNFKVPSRKTVRIDRARKGAKLFTALEIRSMIDGALLVGRESPELAQAGRAMRAMILLGINCRYGNADCARLAKPHLDLDAGMLDHPRRRCLIAMDPNCRLAFSSRRTHWFTSQTRTSKSTAFRPARWRRFSRTHGIPTS